MQWTSFDLMGETGKPDKSQDSFQNRTCVRKHDTASQESYSEDHRDKRGGSKVGITQYCIQHGEILLFDEADRIIGGFGQEKRVKYRLIQSWKLEKEKSKCQRNYNERDGLSRRKRVESGGRSRKLLYTYIPLSWCGGARS